RRAVKPAAVALAFLVARAGVSAPIASATSLAQVESLIRAATLELSGEALAARGLDAASDRRAPRLTWINIERPDGGLLGLFPFGRREHVAMSLIDLDALRQAPLVREPFNFTVIKQVIRPADG